MKTHFFNLPLRFATALCLLLLAAAHPAFGAVTYTGDAIDVGPAVIVGQSGQGSLTIDGGSSLSKSEGYLGLNTGSNGTVNVNGGNWTNSNDLYIADSGTGSLTITNGTVSNTNGRVGYNAGSNGTVNMSGGNWTNSSTLTIGNSGTGSLTISNGTVSNTTGTVGYGPGTTGTVNVSGGNWTNSGALNIGMFGNGSLTITDGTVANTTGRIGWYPGSSGIVNVNGGTWTNDGISVGLYSTGSLTISSGTVVNAGNLSLGVSAGSNGTVNMSGGTLANSGNLTIGSAGNGTLNLTGNGTVTVGGGLVTLANTSGKTGTLNLGNGTTAGTLSAATITGGNGTAVVNINQSASYTLSSNMTGSLSLNHLGTGTTTLMGTNTYAGATTISAGTVQIGNGGTTGTITGNITNNAALVFNRSNDSTFTAGLSGTGSLEKLGAGVLTIANGTHTVGATTINGGGLVLSSSSTLNATSAVANSGAITIGQGSSLVVSGSTPIFQNTSSLFVSNNPFENDPSISVFNLQNSQFLRSISGNLNNPTALAFDGSGNLYVANRFGNTISKFSSNGTFLSSISGNMGNPFGLAIDGSGNIYVANSSGNTLSKFSSNGTFLNSISGNMSSPYGLAIDESGNIYVANNSGSTLSKFSSNGTFLSSISGNMSSPRGVVLDGSGNIYVANNSGSTFSKFSSNGTFLSRISGNMDEPSALAIGNYTTMNGSTPNGLTLAASASDNATLNLGTYGGSDTTATLTTPFITFGNGTAALNLNLAGNYTLSSDLTGGNSNSTLNQLGTGTTTLTSANSTYAGAVNVSSGTLVLASNLANATSTTISAGTLQLGDGGTTGSIAGNILNNGTLAINRSDDLVFSNTVNGTGSVTKDGNGNLTLTADNTYTGSTAISAGTLSIGNGGTSGSITGDITNNAALVFNRSDVTTYSGAINGSGSVTKKGSGTLKLTADNSYSGGTSIQNGTLSVQAPTALGSGNVSLSAGSLLVASGQEMPGSLQIGGNFDWTGGTIAYYDTGSSPGSNDMQIVVGGNFTASAGNKTFDFSQVDALNSGNYTLVLAGNVTVNLADLIATHGPETTLNGTFSSNGTTIVYTVTGATSGGNVIQNFGGPNTPLVSDYAITTSTITVGSTNAIRSMSFSNSASLTINATGQLTITSGNLSVQSGGTSVVSGGTLITSGSLAKQGAGELDLESNTVVNGVATVVEGLLSVNAQLNANSVVVDPTATLGGAGVIVAQNVVVNGNLSPGNSPGTLNVVGNLVLTGANSTIIEIASLANFDHIVVSGTATLGGTLNAVGYEGYTIAPGSRFDFLQAGSIVGAYDSIIAPEGLRARFLNSGTVGTLLFGPGSYVMMAINQNQRNVAEALDTFILATEGDPLTVSVALDSLTTEQFPAAFDQIMPGFYESLGDILIEQTYNQAQLLTQRLGSVRLGATGFQAIGMSQPIKYDKDGKSAADAKTASPIVESAIETNWNSWVIANGEFSLSRGLSGVPNYNNNAGGFLVGADYRLSENFDAGLFAGYEYSYAKYDGGSSTRGNSALFGLYGTYTHEDGYYADAIVSGGYTGFQTRRSIEFSTIDRTASAEPNSGQFSAALNLGKDFEIGKFTLGPIIGAQYTYAGIGGFTETGADSLDLALGQQNANSLRTNLGARLAYNWEVGSNITLIPEVRGFWMHEFLNNPRNISSALEGGSGPSFDYETSAPYRNSVFGGAGISAKFADRWSASVFYNVNFGAEGYTNNIISTSLGFSF